MSPLVNLFFFFPRIQAVSNELLNEDPKHHSWNTSPTIRRWWRLRLYVRLKEILKVVFVHEDYLCKYHNRVFFCQGAYFLQ